jgi:hypothetical protein
MEYRLRREKQQNTGFYMICEKLLAKRVSKPSIFLISYLLNFFLFPLAPPAKTFPNSIAAV